MVELMRLRHEIILAASECAILEDIYMGQAKACNVAKQIDKENLSAVSFDIIDIQ